MNPPAAFVDQIREMLPSDASALDEATHAACGCENSRRESPTGAAAFPPAHGKVVALIAARKHHRVPQPRVVTCIARRDFTPKASGSGATSMMRGSKDLFDPGHIREPGKLLSGPAHG